MLDLVLLLSLDWGSLVNHEWIDVVTRLSRSPDAPVGPRAQWLATAVGSLSRPNGAGRGSAVELRTEFGAALEQAALSAEELEAAATELASSPEVPAALRAWLGLLLASVVPGAAAAGKRGELRGAEILLSRASDEPGAGPQVLLRLAELRSLLGDAEGASSAMGVAARHSPLLRWALGSGAPAAGAGGERPADDAADLAVLVARLRDPGGRAAALAALRERASQPGESRELRLVVALESVGDALAMDDVTMRVSALDALSAELESALGHWAVAAFGRAIVAVARGDAAEAAQWVSTACAAATGVPASSVVAAAVVGELRQALLVERIAVADIVWDGWLAALFDPVGALAMPRGGLVSLRQALVGLVTAAMLAGCGASAWRVRRSGAPDAHDPWRGRGDSPTLSAGVGLEWDGGDDAEARPFVFVETRTPEGTTSAQWTPGGEREMRAPRRSPDDDTARLQEALTPTRPDEAALDERTEREATRRIDPTGGAAATGGACDDDGEGATEDAGAGAAVNPGGDASEAAPMERAELEARARAVLTSRSALPLEQRLAPPPGWFRLDVLVPTTQRPTTIDLVVLRRDGPELRVPAVIVHDEGGLTTSWWRPPGAGWRTRCHVTVVATLRFAHDLDVRAVATYPWIASLVRSAWIRLDRADLQRGLLVPRLSLPPP